MMKKRKIRGKSFDCRRGCFFLVVNVQLVVVVSLVCNFSRDAGLAKDLRRSGERIVYVRSSLQPVSFLPSSCFENGSIWFHVPGRSVGTNRRGPDRSPYYRRFINSGRIPEPIRSCHHRFGSNHIYTDTTRARMSGLAPDDRPRKRADCRPKVPPVQHGLLMMVCTTVPPQKD